MMIFERMRFQFPWRLYQQRVLNKLDAYAINNRIHIVAAPGAGKTVLGLEMVRRLARKAIILSPTRIIRDQWLYRLGDFGIDKDWHTNSELSIDLNGPAHITSITYQALHAYYSKEDTYQNLIKEFEQKKINLIVLDEAHHLRSEWWKALEKLVASIDNLMIISLTATPPYDVKESEWQRYEKLCGPIDEEISVPELVKSGTLCPHQDYIYAVDASMHEQERLSSYYEAVKRLCVTLFNCSVFERVILTYSFLQEHDLNINAIEKELPAILAMLSYLRDKKLFLPEHLIQMLDLQDEYIPEFDMKQWQTLLDQLFFRKHYFNLDKEQNAYVRQLKSQLRQSGMLIRRELNLTHSRSLSKMLKMSVKKIDACVKINSLERVKRKDKLRQVILTDYIRDEQLTHKKVSQHDSLGAWPIFKRLVNDSRHANRFALLTGRLCVVHVERLPSIRVKNASIEMSPFEPVVDMVKLKGPLNKLTELITSLLVAGEIHTLVGTSALLGEGWDAPVINSLIIASTVGTFMLSNQLRGRAIRASKYEKEKKSSIWHLMTLTQASHFGLSDLYSIYKRFGTFVGLSNKKVLIENGYERLNLPAINCLDSELCKRTVSQINRFSIGRYNKIEFIKQRWEEALAIEGQKRLVPSLKSNNLPHYKFFHFINNLPVLLEKIFYSLFFGFCFYLRFRIPGIMFPFTVVSVIAFIRAKEIYKTAAILTKHLPVSGTIRQIGIALYRTLCEIDAIKTDADKLDVKCFKLTDGKMEIVFIGGTYYEGTIFIDCLNEILLPIQKPRYLISRRGKFLTRNRYDYHAVPSIIGVKKGYAEIFEKHWQCCVSNTELIYTRNEKGRSILAKARVRSLSSVFRRDTERREMWR